jgi:multiple sugar transport system permease protein
MGSSRLEAGAMLNFIKKRKLLGLLLFLPTQIWILSIVVFPVGLACWISFYRQRTIELNPPFVGLANYSKIIQSLLFWQSLQRTVIWTIANLVLIIAFGLFLALFLNLDYKITKVMRNWILLPWMFPLVITCLMWRVILEPTVGILNSWLKEFGIITSYISFLGNPSWAMSTVIMVNVWRWTPFMTVVMLAALQTIPLETLEAAKVDGATPWQRFWFVTFPQILPSFLTTSFILTMWLLNMFPTIWLLTEGGPAEATTTLPILIYKYGFKILNMSMASAHSVILLFICAAIAIIYLRTLNKLRLKIH